MSCFWGCDWTKWSEIKEIDKMYVDFKSGIKTPFVAKQQTRKCNKCNMIEERRVD